MANADDASAQAVTRRIRQQMQTVYAPDPKVSWSELYPQPHIDVVGGAAHLTRFAGLKGVFRRTLPIRELSTMAFSTFLGTTPITP